MTVARYPVYHYPEVSALQQLVMMMSVNSFTHLYNLHVFSLPQITKIHYVEYPRILLGRSEPFKLFGIYIVLYPRRITESTETETTMLYRL